MMASTTPPGYFDELKEWSDRKLRLLENYLDPAVKILGSIDQVFYVDGFAGVGIYGDGAKGSPVRAAELALQNQQQGKPYLLRCINVEHDPSHFANLQANTASFGNLVLNLSGAFADNVDRILHEARGKPIICFLDPFGVKGIDWQTIEKLINRKGATDLWIRFDIDTIKRHAGAFAAGIVGGDGRYDILRDFYGISSHAALQTKLAGTTPEARAQKALDLYIGQLRAKHGYAASYAIRSLQGETKYHLVFATAHPKGAILASDVVYNVEETYQRELQAYKEANTQQLSLFSLDPSISIEPTEQEVFDELKEHIKKHCQGRNLSRQDVHITLLAAWFGKIGKRHLTAALKALEDEKSIIERDGPPSKDRTRFTFRS